LKEGAKGCSVCNVCDCGKTVAEQIEKSPFLQVGWVRSDSKAIQAIHDKVITYNKRVDISGDLSSTFNLHISSVKEEDRGEMRWGIKK